MPQLVRVIISACAAAGLLAACNDGDKGSPFSGDSGGLGAAPVAGANPLFQVDACTMLAPDVLQEFGVTEPGHGSFKTDEAPEDRGGNLCSWQDHSSHMITVMVNEGSPSGGTESTVDGRRAVRIEKPDEIDGSCETAIVIEEHVDVVVRVDSSDDMDAMCAMVDKALPSVSAAIPG